MSSPASLQEIEYPSSDGLPMADNTLQFQWIQLLANNLELLFRERRDVFVGGNLFWYPVQGRPRIRRAPDGFVVFDRPPGHRSSYRQWEENDTPMTVVFEIRSPNDGDPLMRRKLAFYERHGVEEYYLIDPDRNTLEVYRRNRDRLAPQPIPRLGYVSPRLGIRIAVDDTEVRVYCPDGSDFVRPVDLVERAEVAEAERDEVIEELEQSEDERLQAEQARLQAEQARLQAEARLAQSEARLVQSEARLARISVLGQRMATGIATPDDLAEFARLTTSPE